MISTPVTLPTINCFWALPLVPRASRVALAFACPAAIAAVLFTGTFAGVMPYVRSWVELLPYLLTRTALTATQYGRTDCTAARSAWTSFL